MANLLTITKKPIGYFDFVVNGDISNIVTNAENAMLGFKDLCHFKSKNGANIIKEQNITFGNITLIDGVTTLPQAVSMDDLILKLESIGFFEWRTSGGGGGVDRFDELLDTFNYFGKDGQVPVVDEAQLRLIAKVLPNTDYLNFFPSPLVPGQILQVNSTGDGYILVNPPAGANGYVQAFTYTSPDPQEFTLATTASLISVVINGTLVDPVDWSQSGNLLTILPSYTLGTNDRIIATGVI